MMMLRLYPRSNLILISIFFLAVSCSPQPTPTPFRPPTEVLPTQVLPTVTPAPALPSPTPNLIVAATPTEGPCTSNLTFLDDVTIDDGTAFSPGATIDKQWLVRNDGTCDWDTAYKLKWVGGITFGVVEEQPLYPARAGAQATLRILFVAPVEPGTYQSTWQALDPNGNLFGDTVFMEIIVE